MRLKQSIKILLAIGVLAVLSSPLPGCNCLSEKVNRVLETDGPVQEVWLKHYSEGDWLHGEAITLDSSGNIYATGDDITVKCDNKGKKIWACKFDGEAIAIALDNSDNVYVTGTRFDSISQYDYITIKYDNDGKELWRTYYDGSASNTDAACAMAVDQSGNVYVTGYSNSNASAYDYVTIKYDNDGKELWTARYDGPSSHTGSWDASYDMAMDMVIDSSGNVYVTGFSRGIDSSNDYATVMYDTDGNELWIARYEPGDYVYAVAVDEAGYIYVSGSSGTIKYDKSGNHLWHASTGGNDLAFDSSGNVIIVGENITKYDSSGNQIWMASPNTIARAVALDNSDNVCIVGDFCNLIKYDSNGSKVWSVKYKAEDDYYSGSYNALVVDASGNVYVTGSVTLSVKENIINGDHTPYNAFAIAKYIEES